MKTFLSLAILFIIFDATDIHAQKKASQNAKEQTDQGKKNALFKFHLICVQTSYYHFLVMGNAGSIGNDGAKENFTSYIRGKDSSESKEMSFFIRNKEQIENMIMSFSFIDSRRCLFSDGDVPVEVFSSDSGTIFFLKGIFTEYLFNTLRLSSRQQAAKVISSLLLKGLEIMNEDIADKSIKYFGIGALYANKDASVKDDPLNTKSEYVYVIAKRSLISSYTKGSITEEDFIDKASIFLADRSGDLGGFKRVKVKVE